MQNYLLTKLCVCSNLPIDHFINAQPSILREILQDTAFIKKKKKLKISSIYPKPGEHSLHLFIQR